MFRALGCSLLVACAAACSGAGQYVWFTDLPANQNARPPEFLIHVGDTISMHVLGHEEMTLKQKVRSDGRIAVPLIGEIDALDKRPSSLRAELEARLKDYIVSPSVMLSIDEVQPMTVVLLGEVGHPGSYTLEPYSGLAAALAAGGGLTEYARRDRIFVVRQRPTPARIRFTYDAISHDQARAAAFPLHNGDVVVVE
jgi:polysaccharide export outer membrane protein